MIIISHNQHLIEAATNELWVVSKKGSVKRFKGEFQEYKVSFFLFFLVFGSGFFSFFFRRKSCCDLRMITSLMEKIQKKKLLLMMVMWIMNKLPF